VQGSDAENRILGGVSHIFQLVRGIDVFASAPGSRDEDQDGELTKAPEYSGRGSLYERALLLE
jgi:hypothetical protein